MNNLKSAYVVVIIAICLFCTNIFYFPGNILSWDVFGYYMYLPMIFIYDNWGLQDTGILHKIIEQYNSSSTLYQAYSTSTGQWVMRYPMGMAILYSPFFAIGHLLAEILSYPKDGYSYPYQLSILLGGIIYSITGFIFLRKVLLKFFNDHVTMITLLILFFGTNYLWHSGFHGSNAMSHNFLFTLYAILIWVTIKWHHDFKFKYLLVGGLISGLIIISRPSELVCLLIPILWGVGFNVSLKEKLVILFNRKYELLSFGLIVFVICLPQLLYWKIVAGKFLYNSYGDNPGEGFEFLNPYITEVLFSFRKGWLVYTPLMIFAIAGLIYSIYKKTVFSTAVVSFFLINLYIVSSWSCWWYAESYSQRSLIQSYAVMALPMGIMINYFSGIKNAMTKRLLYMLLVALVSLNIFQTWQFLDGLIHPSRMTKQAYFSTFLKLSKPVDFDDLLMINRDIKITEIDAAKYNKTKVINKVFEQVQKANSVDSLVSQGAFKLNSSDSYSPAIETAYESITSKDHAFLKITMKVFITDAIETKGSLVAAMYHKGYSYGYGSADLENLKLEKNQWNDVALIYMTPVIRNSNDVLKIYYWHRDSSNVFIDQLKVEVWEAKE